MNTLKFLISCLLLFTVLDSAKAQTQKYAFSNPDINILYRGYSNPVKISLGENCSNCKIIPMNLTLVKRGDQYVAKPGRNRTASIHFVDSLSSDTVKSVYYRVQNLPNPKVYWGGKPSGAKVSINSSLVQCKYGPSIPLLSEFEIIKIQLSSNDIDRDVTVTGKYLSKEFKDAIKSIPVGNTFCLICDVKGSDGVVRKIAGCYTR